MPAMATLENGDITKEARKNETAMAIEFRESLRRCMGTSLIMGVTGPAPLGILPHKFNFAHGKSLWNLGAMLHPY